MSEQPGDGTVIQCPVCLATYSGPPGMLQPWRDNHQAREHSVHVDVLKVDPLSSAPPKFIKRVALDDPLMVNPDGKPTQVATGWATYVCVSEPHTMEDCPHA